MSITAFLTMCILGIDFLIYAMFQWTLGDKRRALERRLAGARKNPLDLNEKARRPFVINSRDDQSQDTPDRTYASGHDEPPRPVHTRVA